MGALRDRYVRPLDGELLGTLNDEFLFAAEDLPGDIRVNVFLKDDPECTLADGILSARTAVDFLAGGDVPEGLADVALAAEDIALEKVRRELPEGVSVEASGEPRVERGNVCRLVSYKVIL